MTGILVRLTGTVGAIVLATTVAVSLAGYAAGRGSVERQIGERIGATTRTAAAETDAYLGARVEELRQMSTSALQVRGLSPADRAKLLADYANAFGSNRYTEIAILDTAGRTTVASSGAPSYARQNALSRTFAAAVRPGVTDLVRFADQPNPVFVVYAPLFDEDFHRTGTLVARLQTTELAGIVRAIPVDDATALFVLHRGAPLADHRGSGAPAAPGARGAFEAAAPVSAAGLGLSVVAAADGHAVLAPMTALALRSVAIGAIVLALAWLATALTARRIARPLREVAHAATRLASGDLDARVARAGGVRETAELADAFNAMSETLRELIGSVGQASRTVAETAHETQASARAVARESEAQARASAHIATALAGVAEGTRTIERDVAALERVARDGRAHVEALIDEVHGTSSAVEQLRASVDRSNEAGRALAAHAAGVAETAREVAERAGVATASARRGDAAVRALVGDVRDVGEALGRTASRLAHLADATIGAIGAQIEVVDDMAERSKLLALNAAIESARAGEHGRGFAVIAQELHRLATTSQDAGGTVKTLVAGVVEETRSLVRGAHEAHALAAGAVERASLTGGTIALLAAEIGDNAADARAIGAIADEQAARAAEIEQATAEMRRMAEATARAAQVAGELSGRVAEAIGMAADVAAGVAGETRAQAEAVAVIERGAAGIDAAIAQVAAQAQRASDATDALRTEIQSLADGVARFDARERDGAAVRERENENETEPERERRNPVVLVSEVARAPEAIAAPKAIEVQEAVLALA